MLWIIESLTGPIKPIPGRIRIAVLIEGISQSHLCKGIIGIGFKVGLEERICLLVLSLLQCLIAIAQWFIRLQPRNLSMDYKSIPKPKQTNKD